MKRIYHHCDQLEEAPMWDNTKSCNDMPEYASNLMREIDVFESAMRKAINQWPYACEHNLSASVINRKAWLGHAGCFLEIGSTENCTRKGWHMLNQEEQDLANNAAQKVIKEWENAKNLLGY